MKLSYQQRRTMKNIVTYSIYALVNLSLVLSPVAPWLIIEGQIHRAEAAAEEASTVSHSTVERSTASHQAEPPQTFLPQQDLPPYNDLSVCWVQHWNGQGHTEWRITNPNNVPLVSNPDTKIRYNWRVFDGPNATGNQRQSAQNWDNGNPNPVNTVYSQSIELEWYIVQNGQATDILGTALANADASGDCNGGSQGGDPPATATPTATATPDYPPYNDPTACWVQHWNGQGHTEWQILNDNPSPLVSNPDTKIRYNWRAYDALDGNGSVRQSATNWDNPDPNPVNTAYAQSLELEWFLVINGQPTDILGSVIVNADESGSCTPIVETPTPTPTETPDNGYPAFEPLDVCWVQHWNGQGHTEWRITNNNSVPISSSPDVRLRYNWIVYNGFDATSWQKQSAYWQDSPNPNPVNTAYANSIKLEWFLTINWQATEILGSVIVNADASGDCAAQETPTATPTNSPTATASPTQTTSPTVTVTSSPTQTPSPTHTATPTYTFTPSNTPTGTPPPTDTPTNTPTPSDTPTQTPTSTFTNTPTATASPTITPTHTSTPTITPSPTAALPSNLVCSDWREGSQEGWFDTSTEGFIIWDTNGMYGNGPAGLDEARVSVAFEMQGTSPWILQIDDNLQGDYVVSQGDTRPQAGDEFDEKLLPLHQGNYFVSRPFIQIEWTVSLPLDLNTTPIFFSTCYTETVLADTPNNAPIMEAGEDVFIPLGLDGTATVQIDGTGFDDCLPRGVLNVSWEVLAAAGNVTFSDDTIVNPEIIFDALGDYTLVLEGDDTDLTDSDEITIHVIQPADLFVQSLDTSAVSVDPDSLAVSGTAEVFIGNDGLGAAYRAFDIGLFEDHNSDGAYDESIDGLLGSTTLPELASGTATSVQVSLTGTVAFEGSPLYAFVDLNDTILETDESNNIAAPDDRCFITPAGDFTPALEWTWGEAQSITTPLVMDLNGDTLPEIIFISYTGSDYFAEGRLHAISGDGSGEFFLVDDPAYRLRGASTLAVGDVDGDGSVEIFGIAPLGDQFFAFSNTGTPLWTSDTVTGLESGAIALADLDADGYSEIIIGAHVFNYDGTLRWSGTAGTGDNLDAPTAQIVDLDLDDVPEIVAGHTAYRADGSIYWQAPLSDGFTGFGNFDEDQNPEIVLVYAGKLALLDHDGTILWQDVTLRGGGRGGVPTIGDFDSDGDTEIGVAGARYYSVYEGDGSFKWEQPIQDLSSNVTSAVLHDFEGDGLVEVVYRDETSLLVFAGLDGTRLYWAAQSSATAAESPVVADVDGDGVAEILLSSNDHDISLTKGIHVYGDDLNWGSTRPIWNQYTYHITNVNDGGSIPVVEAASWLLYRGTRQNLYTAACDTGEPDLTVSFARVVRAGDDIRLIARVGNAGQIAVPANIGVNFYNSDPDSGGAILGSTQTSRQLQPGQFEDIAIRLPLQTIALPMWVAVDELDTIAELNEDNNRLESAVYLLTDLVAQSVDVSAVTVDPINLERTGVVAATVNNPSTAPANRPFEVIFFADVDGDSVLNPDVDKIIYETTVNQLPAGATTTVRFEIDDTARFIGDLIFMAVDAADTTIEADEGNNVAHQNSDELLPDLTASNVRRLTTETDTELMVRVGNGGTQPVDAGVSVAVFDGDPNDGGSELTRLTTATQLLPGAFEDITWAVPLLTNAIPVWVHVDIDDAVAEFDEDNNLTRTHTYLTDPPNEPPVVEAGPELTVVIDTETNLEGLVTDDGLPIDQLTTLWTVDEAPEGSSVILGDETSPTSTILIDTLGVYTLTLAASDDEYVSEDTLTIEVVDGSPPDVLALAFPGFIEGPDFLAQVSGRVPITLTTETNLTAVSVDYWRANDPSQIYSIASGLTVSGGEIVTYIDTTVLSNDSWTLRVRGLDATDGWVASATTFAVVGENKPGRVTLSTTDVVVPVVGLPISVSRTYDSLERDIVGDFGNGWKLDLGNPRVEVSPTHDVTITLPNGERSTFFFRPEFNPIYGFLGLPKYRPEAGTYGSLRPRACGLVTQLSDGRIFCFPGNAYDLSLTGFIYTDPYGREFVMNREGHLERITDLNGNTLTFSPDGIAHSADGSSVDFVRDAEGRITQITDPEGAIYRYIYDAEGNLVEVDLPDTDQNILYDYDNRQLFLSGTDARGNDVVTSTYYADGRLQTVTDGLNNTTRYAYDVDNNITTVTYPDGGVEVMLYNAAGYLLQRTDPLNRVTSFTYDADFNVLTETNDLGETVTYTYESNGHRTSVRDGRGVTVISAAYNQYGGPLRLTDALGQTREIGYDPFTAMPLSASDNLGSLGAYTWNTQGSPLTRADADGAVTRFSYDDFGNVLSVTDPLSRATTFTYDDMGRQLTRTDALSQTTAYTYDAFGRVETMTDADNETWVYDYDGNGNRTSVIDPLNRVTTYAYDANNNLTTINYPDGTTITRTYDFRGNVVTETDETGIVTAYGYDLAGQMTTVTIATGTSEAATTTFEYDDAGRLTRAIDPLNHATSYVYDAAGRLISVTDALNNATTYTYDNAGQLTAETDAENRTTQYRYDSRGRQTQTIYPDGTTMRHNYDGVGRRISSTDPNGLTTTYAYDDVGNLLSVTNPMNETTSYSYDAVYNLLSITDANTHTTTFEYDNLNRQSRKIWPDDTFEEYTYDALGNMTAHRLPDGNSNTYGYDERYRLVTESFFDGRSVSYTYTDDGLRESATDERGVTTYTYDNQRRPIHIRQPDGQAVAYAYDAVGNRTSMTTPAGTTTYAYDDLNRLISLTDPRDGTSSMSYDDVGMLQGITRPNGVMTDYDYDALNRLLSVSHHTGASVLASFDYTLDNVGNRLSVEEHGGNEIAWEYDDAYRLVSETRLSSTGTPTHTTAFTYDATGNRQSQTVDGITTTYSYNDLDQLTQSVTDGVTTTYNYDLRGNLTAVNAPEGISTYTWDALDRMTAAFTPNGAASYAYDVDGQRVQEVVDGVENNFLWDELSAYGDVVLEYDENLATTKDYTLAGMMLISQHQGGATSYFHSDGQNSTRALSDASGLVTDTYDFTAYGELYSQNGSTANRYLYTGQQFDAVTGQYSLRARHYNPVTGRFNSRDKFSQNTGDFLSCAIECEQCDGVSCKCDRTTNDGCKHNSVEFNLYGYSTNSPITNYDPTGNFAQTAFIQSKVVIAGFGGLPPVGFKIAVELVFFILAILVITESMDLALLTKKGRIGGEELENLRREARKLKMDICAYLDLLISEEKAKGSRRDKNWIRHLDRLKKAAGCKRTRPQEGK